MKSYLFVYLVYHCHPKSTYIACADLSDFQLAWYAWRHADSLGWQVFERLGVCRVLPMQVRKKIRGH